MMNCTKCSAELRKNVKGKPNTNTLCAKCKVYSTAAYQRARYVKRPPRPISRMGHVAHVAIEDARKRGHVVEYMSEDADHDTWIGSCDRCGGFLVVDKEAEDRYGRTSVVYGKLFQGHCPGERVLDLAPRRDPFQEEQLTRVTEAKLPSKELGVIQPNWDDPQGYNLGKNRAKGAT